MSKFDLFSESKKIPRAEKKIEEKSKKVYVRFTISNNFVEFSPDLWERCFDGMNSIEFRKTDEDDNGNKVDWTYIKGHKEKVDLKNNEGLHQVKVRKNTGRRYLNLNKETFDDINEMLNVRKGGTKSRAYGSSFKGKIFPEGYISPNENIIIVDHNDEKNWKRSSKERVKKTDKKDKPNKNNSK